MNATQSIGFEREELFIKVLSEVSAVHGDFKAKTLKKIISNFAPEFLIGLFEDRPCKRQLKFIGSDDLVTQPADHLHDTIFEIGKTYQSKSYNGSTYTIDGFERRIGSAYFEITKGNCNEDHC